MEIRPPTQDTSIVRLTLDIVSQPELRIAFWSGVGGVMRALTMKTPLWESIVCVFMAIDWGVVLYPFAEPLFSFVFAPFFGKVVGLPLEAIQRAIAVMVGLTGVAITGFIIDFFSAWRNLRLIATEAGK